jgi:hypothetical protein
MSLRFVVQADRETVGLAIRSPGGFRFYSSDQLYARLEGRVFASARALERSVARLAESLRRRRAAARKAGPGRAP